MITAEIKVNGVMIAHVYVVNQGAASLDPDVDGLCEYHYEYYRPEHSVIRGKAEHFRPNGAAALLKEVFEDVEGKGGK